MDSVARAAARFIAGTGETVFVIGGALILGFGVPAGWLWIASQLWGKTGAVNGWMAAFIAAGILTTYMLALLGGAWMRGFMGHGESDGQKAQRAVWNRSMRDSHYKAGTGDTDSVERMFIATTVVAAISFMIWFAFFAGDSTIR